MSVLGPILGPHLRPISLSLTRAGVAAAFAELNLLAPTLDPRITFTGGPVSYIGSDGLLHYSAANEWPLEYDPITRQPVGRSAWEARTNLLLWSEDLTNSAWLKNSLTPPAITAAAAIAPDGSMTADKVAPSTVTHFVAQQATVSAGQTYIFTFFAKRGSMTDMKYSVYDSTNTADVVPPTSYFAKVSATGWSRITVTATAPAGCTALRFYVLRDSGVTGDCYIWGAQIEQAATPGPYIPTTTAAVTRAADVDSVSPLSAIRYNAASGVFYVEHSVANGLPLLASGSNTILTSQGPGKIAVSYNATGSSVSYNGGAPVAGGVLTFGTDLKLGIAGTAYAHGPIKRVRYYPNGANIQAITA